MGLEADPRAAGAAIRRKVRRVRGRLVACCLATALPLASGAAERFEWPRSSPEALGMDGSSLRAGRDYALFDREDPHRGGSGYVVYQGKLVLAWGSPTAMYQLKSASKSIGVTALGLAIQEGRMKLSDAAGRFHPSFGAPPKANAASGWLEEITLLQLATHTAGIDRSHGYRPLVFRAGSAWSYSDGGPNWLAECITLEYRRDVAELLFERVFTPLGITESDLTWRDSYYRPDRIHGIKRREFGSGVRANVDAMARIGYLYLRKGKWQGEQILPQSFVDAVGKTPESVRGLPVRDPSVTPGASDHYGLLWWNNGDGTLENVPKDAYWAWGGMQGRDTESLIVVIPSLDLVVARAGTGWGDGTIDYRFLAPFLEPIARSVSPTEP